MCCAGLVAVGETWLGGVWCEGGVCLMAVRGKGAILLLAGCKGFVALLGRLRRSLADGR